MMQIRDRLVPSRLAWILLTPLLLLATGAQGTWSVVAVDTNTREVGVAAATCLSADLQVLIPVVRVGKGAGIAQAVVDHTGINRQFIRDAIERDVAPDVMINTLARWDPYHSSRQYGIVTFDGAPLTFTGANVRPAHAGVAGVSGSYRYAVQGNLLTDAVVVKKVLEALLGTPGELADKLMQALLAAHPLGGDGRCSCSQQEPTRCGAPPPAFRQSARSAFLIVARADDDAGGCGPTHGCANGDYYLSLQHVVEPDGDDPVLELQRMYQHWRASGARTPKNK